MQHIPVLVKETLEGLNLSPGKTVVDATVGLGGHAKLILDAIAPNGRLIAFDRDRRNLDLAEKVLSGYAKRVTFIHDSFAGIAKHDLSAVDAILFDLGVSSVHLEEPSRGFSFQKEGPLDMRFDDTQELSAETIVNGWSQLELTDLFRRYGNEPRAPQIAKAITHRRRKDRLTTTTQLAELIEQVSHRRSRIHPATRVFQALRMAVNDELGEIDRGIKAAIDLLAPGGRIVIISFHSLEDRLAKQILKGSDQLELITKKVIQPSYEEKRANPRSRSAKLRVAEKIDQ